MERANFLCRGILFLWMVVNSIKKRKFAMSKHLYFCCKALNIMVIDRIGVARRMSKRTSQAVLCVCLALLSLFCGCVGGYSFTGASIPADAKTISIANFPNYATTVNPQLSQILSDGLRNTFSSQTNLVVTEQGGDLDLSGEITTYTVQPTAITSNDQAAMNRLTIGVKVSFTNSKDPNANFEQSFNRYKEFSAQLNFSSVENSLVEEIVNEIIEDIFNKAVVNW